MSCDVELLKEVTLFAALDNEELAILASQVDYVTFAPRQRIYKMGASSDLAYIMVSGAVAVTTVDEDGQEVELDRPVAGGLFGFASMLERTPHQTEAVAIEQSVCIEVDLDDLLQLISRKPDAALDMLTMLGRHIHAAQRLVQGRSLRHPNQVIEEQETVGERVADVVASFGGSWSFITIFAVFMMCWTAVNVILARRAWDPYPFILLNLFLSMLAAIQAPVIMMSQNRQDKKDRLRGELDYEVNRRALDDIRGLAHKLNLLVDRLGDLEERIDSTNSKNS